MKTIHTLAIAAVALFAFGAATTAEAKDRRHHRHHSSRSYYNPLYGNYAYYHDGRGPTSGYWGRGYDNRYRTYSYRHYDGRPSIAFGGSRHYYHGRHHHK